MVEIDVKEMLEAGVHFGHKKDKWNPKMRPFIYTERDSVHIFNLILTADLLKKAQDFAAKTTSEGGTILFVGTKKQIQKVVKEAAENAGMPYMIERWLGGMLTNFTTILSRLKYLKETEQKSEGESGLTKKENLNISRELTKLNAVFEGIRELRKLPDALFIADVIKEKTAVREAAKLGIPVIGIVDSNADPSKISFPIPANDDAVRSVKYISDKISESIAKNKKSVNEEMLHEEPESLKKTKSVDVKSLENTKKSVSIKHSKKDKKIDKAETSVSASDTDETESDKGTSPDKKSDTIVNEKDEVIDKLEMDAAEKSVVKKSRINEEPLSAKKDKK